MVIYSVLLSPGPLGFGRHEHVADGFLSFLEARSFPY